MRNPSLARLKERPPRWEAVLLSTQPGEKQSRLQPSRQVGFDAKQVPLVNQHPTAPQQLLGTERITPRDLDLVEHLSCARGRIVLTDPHQPRDDGDLIRATTSVPIDLTGYEIPPDSQPLRAYKSDETRAELYLDGAGGVTNDPKLAVAPSAHVSDLRGTTVDADVSDPRTAYSDLNGFYASLVPQPGRKERPPAQPTPPAMQTPASSSPQVLQPTNALAVVALVFALIGGALLAIVFGHVALSQIRQSSERGEGMAKAALIIGYLVLVASVIFLIVSLATAASALSA